MPQLGHFSTFWSLFRQTRVNKQIKCSVNKVLQKLSRFWVWYLVPTKGLTKKTNCFEGLYSRAQRLNLGPGPCRGPTRIFYKDTSPVVCNSLERFWSNKKNYTLLFLRSDILSLRWLLCWTSNFLRLKVPGQKTKKQRMKSTWLKS